MLAPQAYRCALFLIATSLPAFSEEGVASKYGRESGSRVACGGALNERAFTAAHKTLPCGARVRVTNKSNGRSVVVTINDRGPYRRGWVIDLTPAAAGAIGVTSLAPVSLTQE
jgi:rare lipoprotein A